MKSKLKILFLLTLLTMCFQLSANDNFIRGLRIPKNKFNLEDVDLEITRKSNVQEITISGESFSVQFPQHLSDQAEETLDLEEDELGISLHYQDSSQWQVFGIGVEKIYTDNKIDIEKELEHKSGLWEFFEGFTVSTGETSNYSFIDIEGSVPNFIDELDADTIYVRKRIIISQNHVYEIGSVSTDDVSSETEEFINSFQILHD